MAVHCEGFKSRIWATGFDISDHAVLSSIVQPPKQKRNTINFKNFYESARPEIIEIFKNFDLEPIFLYCNSTVEELSHISESLATTCICGTLGNYLGNGLEEKYGVPYIRTINPLGIAGFETWLREIGRVTERSDAVEKYIAEQRAIYIPQIEKIKNELKGLKAVLGMGPGYTFEVSRVLNELGIEVVWALAWHYDKKYENGDVPPSMEYLLENGVCCYSGLGDGYSTGDCYWEVIKGYDYTHDGIRELQFDAVCYIPGSSIPYYEQQYITNTNSELYDAYTGMWLTTATTYDNSERGDNYYVHTVDWNGSSYMIEFAYSNDWQYYVGDWAMVFTKSYVVYMPEDYDGLVLAAEPQPDNYRDTAKRMQLDSISPEGLITELDTLDPYACLYFSVCC
mgnify:CR=1 FL=1